MRVVAFSARTSGARPYSHAILDLGGVAMVDGEVEDECHVTLQVNDYLDYNIALVKACQVPQSARASASPYHDGVGDFCAWLDHARGSAPAWAFEAKEKAAFVQQSLKYSKLPHGFDRVVDVCGLYGAMMAVGAVAPGQVSDAAILHRLEIRYPEPQVDALERAKMAATAALMLESELREFYLRPPKDEDSLAALPAPAAAPGSEFDPFADDPLPVEGDGDPDRFRKAFFATLGERGLKYEGHDAKRAVRAFLAESPRWIGGPVKSASECPPDVFAERLGPLGRWKDREIRIPVLDEYLAHQGGLAL